MPIYRGDTEISTLYVGDTEVSEVYAGDTLIWSAFSPATLIGTLAYTPANTGANSYTFDLSSFAIQAGDIMVLFTSAGVLVPAIDGIATDDNALVWDRLSPNGIPNDATWDVFTATMVGTESSVTCTNTTNASWLTMRASIFWLRGAAKPTPAEMSQSYTNQRTAPAYTRSILDTDVIISFMGAHSTNNADPTGVSAPLTFLVGTPGLTGGVVWDSMGAGSAGNQTGVIAPAVYTMNAAAAGGVSNSIVSLIVPAA
jgi:hypothetical protein